MKSIFKRRLSSSAGCLETCPTASAKKILFSVKTPQPNVFGATDRNRTFYVFGENSATELDFFGRLRTAKDELLARSVFLLLSRSHAQQLLLFVYLSLSSLGSRHAHNEHESDNMRQPPHSQAVSNGGKRVNPPWQTRCRNRDPQSGCLGYSILLGFSTLLFSFGFSVYFPGI